MGSGGTHMALARASPQGQQPNTKADEVTCLPRVVFSPSEWTLISSRKLLPLLSGLCLYYLEDLLHVPGITQLQADVNQL